MQLHNKTTVVQDLLEQLFSRQNFKQELLQSVLKQTETNKFQQQYDKLRKQLLSLHDIQFAVLGCLHRCGLALHMLRNLQIKHGRQEKPR